MAGKLTEPNRRATPKHLGKKMLSVQYAASDPELEQKTKKATEKISENLHIIANEPSLALYRLQEHVRKSLPQLVEKRIEVNRMYHDLQGKCYDAEYAVHAVKATHRSGRHFQSIQDLLKNAIFVKQQLTYEENRRLLLKKQDLSPEVDYSINSDSMTES